MSGASKRREKQKWTIEKPKLDNARRLHVLLFIEPDDEEFKLIIKAAWGKLEVPMPAAIPHKIPIKSSGETHRNIGKRMTKYACIVDADESTRPRVERSWTQTSSRSHHCKRDEFYDSLQSCSQIHSDASSVKISRCKGSGKKNGKKLENVPAWQLTKVRNKKSNQSIKD